MSAYTLKAAVFVIICDDTGRVLLHQRAGTDYLPGYWDFPSGHVDPGESFASAAVRELAEETSLVASENDLKMVYVGINHTDYPYVNIIFEASNWQGNPTIAEPHKCSGLEFYDLGNLPPKLTLAVKIWQSNGFKPDLSARSYIDTKSFNEIMDQ